MTTFESAGEKCQPIVNRSFLHRETFKHHIWPNLSSCLLIIFFFRWVFELWALVLVGGFLEKWCEFGGHVFGFVYSHVYLDCRYLPPDRSLIPKRRKIFVSCIRGNFGLSVQSSLFVECSDNALHHFCSTIPDRPRDTGANWDGWTLQVDSNYLRLN